MLGIGTTLGLIERLGMDRALRRICGFPVFQKIATKATFSRAFAEFSEDILADRAHEAQIKATLGEQQIGDLSRYGTTIEVRESPVKPKVGLSTYWIIQTRNLLTQTQEDGRYNNQRTKLDNVEPTDNTEARKSVKKENRHLKIIFTEECLNDDSLRKVIEKRAEQSQ